MKTVMKGTQEVNAYGVKIIEGIKKCRKRNEVHDGIKI